MRNLITKMLFCLMLMACIPISYANIMYNGPQQNVQLAQATKDEQLDIEWAAIQATNKQIAEEKADKAIVVQNTVVVPSVIPSSNVSKHEINKEDKLLNKIILGIFFVVIPLLYWKRKYVSDKLRVICKVIGLIVALCIALSLITLLFSTISFIGATIVVVFILYSISKMCE